MFHRLITAAIITAVVLGPQWCCCTVGGAVRWAARFAEAVAVGSEPVACTCCAACVEASRADASDDASDRGSHSCPCRDIQQRAFVVGTAVPAAAAAPELPVEWADIASGGSPSVAGSTAAAPWPIAQADQPPPLSGRALLRAYGILNC